MQVRFFLKKKITEKDPFRYATNIKNKLKINLIYSNGSFPYLELMNWNVN
jgi:hypothetical protein